MYDPAGGRFCGRDPIGFEVSKWNLYQYVSARCLTELDPTGKAIWCSGVSGFGGFLVGVSFSILSCTDTCGNTATVICGGVGSAVGASVGSFTGVSTGTLSSGWSGQITVQGAAGAGGGGFSGSPFSDGGGGGGGVGPGAGGALTLEGCYSA